VEGDLLQVVGDEGNVSYVLQAGLAALTGMDIKHLHAAAICAEVDVVTIQREVLGCIPCSQGITGRSFL
jgi:hypothetical protein